MLKSLCFGASFNSYIYTSWPLVNNVVDCYFLQCALHPAGAACGAFARSRLDVLGELGAPYSDHEISKRITSNPKFVCRHGVLFIQTLDSLHNLQSLGGVLAHSLPFATWSLFPRSR